MTFVFVLYIYIFKVSQYVTMIYNFRNTSSFKSVENNNLVCGHYGVTPCDVLQSTTCIGKIRALIFSQCLKYVLSSQQ